jgi:hypothetical protein
MGLSAEFKTSPAPAGEGDHEVVEGALPPAPSNGHGPNAPSVTFGDTSPVRCRSRVRF